MTVGEGALRARKLEVDKFNAQQAFYAGIPRLGSAAIEAWRHPRTSSYAKDRPRRVMAPKQERARLRVSSRMLAQALPRQRTKPPRPAKHPNGMKHAWQRKAAFWAGLRQALDARAAQP